MHMITCEILLVNTCVKHICDQLSHIGYIIYAYNTGKILWKENEK